MCSVFGRRGTIFICGIFCTLTVIGSACSQTWEQLLVSWASLVGLSCWLQDKVTRLLLGIGMGAKASTVPVFAAENTPASIRGGLVMSWQMWVSTNLSIQPRHFVTYNATRPHSVSSSDVPPTWFCSKLAPLHGVCSLVLPSFLPCLWSLESTSAQSHREWVASSRLSPQPLNRSP